MKCYKCGKEMFTLCDTAWSKHKDGTKERNTEYLCAECRIWISMEVCEYENVDLDEEE